jgi:ABC-type lipoprotein release transport system permease subunit
MSLYLRLAWRNLWRNRRRSLISTSSVLFAVVLSLAMRSMQNGSYDYMIQSVVGLYLGYVQVHGDGYWEKRSLEQSMEVTDSALSSLSRLRHVERVVPRLEAFALMSRGPATRVVQVTGIDPGRENAMTGLARRVVGGRYLQDDDGGILLGEGLAALLHASVGDSVVIYGQGFHGVTAVSQVPVTGIVRLPIPDIDNTTSYLSLSYSRDLSDVRSDLTAAAGPGTEVMTWQEMMPELVQAIQADSAGGVLMLIILYAVIGFGIFGTIMMMTTERTREFGVLLAIGMKRGKLSAVTVLESVMISMLGAVAGVVAGLPVLWYLHLHPIPLTGEYAKVMLAYGLEPVLPFSAAPSIFIAQSAVVLALALLCAGYPLLVIRKLNPVAAIRT